MFDSQVLLEVDSMVNAPTSMSVKSTTLKQKWDTDARATQTAQIPTEAINVDVTLDSVVMEFNA